MLGLDKGDGKSKSDAGDDNGIFGLGDIFHNCSRSGGIPNPYCDFGGVQSSGFHYEGKREENKHKIANVHKIN